MKSKSILLAAILAMTSTAALAQYGTRVPESSGAAVNGGGAPVGTVGSNMRGERGGRQMGDPNGGNPNGSAGGPTSLSGTGSSTYGGVGSPGTTSGR